MADPPSSVDRCQLASTSIRPLDAGSRFRPSRNRRRSTSRPAWAPCSVMAVSSPGHRCLSRTSRRWDRVGCARSSASIRREGSSPHVCASVQATFETTSGGGVGGDNWNVNEIELTTTVGLASKDSHSVTQRACSAARGPLVGPRAGREHGRPAGAARLVDQPVGGLGGTEGVQELTRPGVARRRSSERRTGRVQPAGARDVPLANRLAPAPGAARSPRPNQRWSVHAQARKRYSEPVNTHAQKPALEPLESGLIAPRGSSPASRRRPVSTAIPRKGSIG